MKRMRKRTEPALSDHFISFSFTFKNKIKILPFNSLPALPSPLILSKYFSCSPTRKFWMVCKIVLGEIIYY